MNEKNSIGIFEILEGQIYTQSKGWVRVDWEHEEVIEVYEHHRLEYIGYNQFWLYDFEPCEPEIRFRVRMAFG